MKHFLNDKSLIIAIMNGDESAIEFVYRGYYTYSVSFIFSNSGSDDDAREVFQEAVIVLIHNIRIGRFREESAVKTYLFGICRRLWLKELKRKERIFQLVHQEPIEEVEEFELHSNTIDKFAKMEDALSGLGQKCESIIMKYYLLKESMQTIAEVLGYTNANNVKNQKYKCLQRLKKLYFQ